MKKLIFLVIVVLTFSTLGFSQEVDSEETTPEVIKEDKKEVSTEKKSFPNSDFRTLR